jgi:hypothetical protein
MITQQQARNKTQIDYFRINTEQQRKAAVRSEAWQAATAEACEPQYQHELWESTHLAYLREYGQAGDDRVKSERSSPHYVPTVKDVETGREA